MGASLIEYAKRLFATYKDIDTLYITSDIRGFEDEQDAYSHAKILRNDTITTITREEIESEIED